jgi:hypothetical protein
MQLAPSHQAAGDVGVLRVPSVNWQRAMVMRMSRYCIVWLLLAQKFIDGVLLPAWVPVGPQFRSFLSDRGASVADVPSGRQEDRP